MNTVSFCVLTLDDDYYHSKGRARFIKNIACLMLIWNICCNQDVFELTDEH